ncbi:rz1 lytic protein [Escherichia coli]|uniref:Rz1-like lysis system protein LysC n=1 Tax=Escherichia coli TaxID=562 RepID=UPI00208DAFE8|nr:rz1 lytic protein [Escherichia coli]
MAPLPASLTFDTPVPFIPNPLTYGASLELNVSLLSALGQCNIDKAGIRSIEMRRNALLAAGK